MATDTTTRAPRLKRTLTLWDLILYGVIVIQPVAPMSVFGCSVTVAGSRRYNHSHRNWSPCCSRPSATAGWPGPIPALDPPSPTSARKSIPRSATSPAGAWSWTICSIP